MHTPARNPTVAKQVHHDRMHEGTSGRIIARAPMRASDRYRERLQAVLAPAGVRIDGDRDFDPQVHDDRFYARALAQGSLGLGESYMDGWWDVASLDGFLFRLLDARLDEQVHGLADIFDAVRAWITNQQDRRRSFEVGKRHYDLGNDLYAAMLGKRLVYSCGYWRRAGDLDQAQEAKLDLVCRKLGLQPGMRVLDIGCGWGEALKFAAERYGVSGVGVTVSREQAAYARELCAGLPVEIRLQDYRDLDERFDRAFSIGMFEHVGVKNYRTYFEVVRRCLDDATPGGGLFVLHSIGSNVSRRRTDPWIARYIFPNSMLPSAAQISAASEGLFVMEDWHGFGPDYDRTLQAWRANIESAWDQLPPRYDQRFRRMWRYYLAGAMASFRARRIQLWQVAFSSRGVPGGYIAPR
jgi:cyclopropane-fatty-acyl-phospholipid synthase